MLAISHEKMNIKDEDSYLNMLTFIIATSRLIAMNYDLVKERKKRFMTAFVQNMNLTEDVQLVAKS